MGAYDCILDLPHHVSARHPPMPMADRAAQFSPFAALTGLDELIHETERETDFLPLRSPDEIARLDARLRYLSDCGEPAAVTVTFFRPDGRKQGGSFVTADKIFRRVDTVFSQLEFADRTAVPLEYLFALEGEIFPDENDTEAELAGDMNFDFDPDFD